MNDRPHQRDLAPTTASGLVEIDAGVGVVWDLVADIDALADHSSECTATNWVEGFAGPSVGARFTGTNERSGSEWQTECTITVLDPKREFAFAVDLADDNTYFAKWVYELRPTGRSVILAESVHAPSLASPARIQVLTEMIRATLASIKAAAESTGCSIEEI